MKLFKISQTANSGYDTYDSAVVCAEDEEAARKTHPYGLDYYMIIGGKWIRLIESVGFDGEKVMVRSQYQGRMYDWTNVEDVSVEYLGEARGGMEPGVVCASFNAG